MGSTKDLGNTDERYIVDTETYKLLHPGKDYSMQNLKSDIGRARMQDDEPLSGDAPLIFPTTMLGYNLQTKGWAPLDLDHVTDVTWNKQAFESLVIDNEAKELVQALVENKLAVQKSTDLISGKGSGLVILLNGGPGTGKTFTAEGVAEIAEKPLYRITCGDVGTKPEIVEKYLKAVLHLGKIWDCIVLLDEADVFLEERGLTNLKRNALVSVFLHVLEYYQGILILTSNRVGTFDEAFKSRIQLVLHYENLVEPQRRKIWRNFFSRLKELDEANIDYEDLVDHIDDLGKKNMNGRHIRNAITTARQLAKHQRSRFGYAHLKHVIHVSGKFETYLKTLKGHSDDEIKRLDGLR